jgi:hypothetical protein
MIGIPASKRRIGFPSLNTTSTVEVGYDVQQLSDSISHPASNRSPEICGALQPTWSFSDGGTTTRLSSVMMCITLWSHHSVEVAEQVMYSAAIVGLGERGETAVVVLTPGCEDAICMGPARRTVAPPRAGNCRATSPLDQDRGQQQRWLSA